jgi:hypothetical protein
MRAEAVARADVSSERPRGSPGYWLVVGCDGAGEALILHPRPRGETLPVFGSREDAGAFLAGTFLRAMGAFGGGLTARPIAAQVLASLLSGPLSGVGSVALDPIPGVGSAAVLDLISVDRESFVGHLKDGRADWGHGAGRHVRAGELAADSRFPCWRCSV